jgi:DNA (cytosine-5)-methyltransferase 1
MFRALDLFCGAGGASMGLHRAGFEVTGVDIVNQPRYPFQFRMANALFYPLEGFDFIWASPPCQHYSIMRNLPWLKGKTYPQLLVPVRQRLVESGATYAIENVMGARVRKELPDGLNGLWLCGTMFGLPFYRHRIFETNFFWMQPGHPTHEFTVRNGRHLEARARDIAFGDVRARRGKTVPNGCARIGANVGHAAGVQQAARAMGIDWMKREELTQAIPPAYSEFIGRQAIEYLRRTA